MSFKTRGQVEKPTLDSTSSVWTCLQVMNFKNSNITYSFELENVNVYTCTLHGHYFFTWLFSCKHKIKRRYNFIKQISQFSVRYQTASKVCLNGFEQREHPSCKIERMILMKSFTIIIKISWVTIENTYFPFHECLTTK